MKSVQVSDEVYESLKGFVVDPFDDTLEVVIGRVVEIAEKAKNKWSAFEKPAPDNQPKSWKRDERETENALAL